MLNGYHILDKSMADPPARDAREAVALMDAVVDGPSGRASLSACGQLVSVVIETLGGDHETP